MTSTDAVKKEIARFLGSGDPEVLCITGEWGVGKTYTWTTILDRLRSARSVALARYSYVSLFGIGSLEALKLSAFENLEFLVPQGSTGFERMLSGGNTILKNSKKLAGVAAALPMVGDAISRGQPLLFNSIRNQILCIDDLERRGDISVKDVFGLISYLREQRGCKIVLLLNQTKLDENPESKQEFADYFEKVIDTKLVFAPTALEAIQIAFDGKDALSILIAEYAKKLGVSNIRVLKKIERMIGMVAPVVASLDPAILRQTVHSVMMFGWCKFDAGANPPPIEYLKTGYIEHYLDRKNDNVEPSKDEKRWDAIITEYDFGNLDDFDLALLKFVDTSVLDEDEIFKFAKQNEERYLRSQQAGSFDKAFRPYHDSFADNEDEVCKNLVDGTKANFDIVSRANFDFVLSILRNLGRDQARCDCCRKTQRGEAGSEFRKRPRSSRTKYEFRQVGTTGASARRRLSSFV